METHREEWLPVDTCPCHGAVRDETWAPASNSSEAALVQGQRSSWPPPERSRNSNRSGTKARTLMNRSVNDGGPQTPVGAAMAASICSGRLGLREKVVGGGTGHGDSLLSPIVQVQGEGEVSHEPNNGVERGAPGVAVIWPHTAAMIRCRGEKGNARGGTVAAVPRVRDRAEQKWLTHGAQLSAPGCGMGRAQ
jgi:hypothetical protein